MANCEPRGLLTTHSCSVSSVHGNQFIICLCGTADARAILSESFGLRTSYAVAKRIIPGYHRKQRGSPMKARLGITLMVLLWSLPAVARLPEAFNGWKGEKAESISAAQLSGIAGPDAGLLREYGFVEAERRPYVRQESRLTVTLWTMRDTTGSFGLFTYYRQPGMTGREGQDLLAVGPDLLLLHRGPYLLEAR